MAETAGKIPKEISEGLLVPLQKPGKKQGPPSNLRPVIVLTTLRKILAICMLDRTLSKIRSRIPITQAAYQSGRSTTEHVFTFKVLAEKAITSKDFKVVILMLDMSKAFDTVLRKDLLQLMKEILDEDEIHIMKILLTNIKYHIKIGQEIGDLITTNIGFPQGDCLSPVLFTLYLANTLKNENECVEHSYCKH